MPWFGLTGFPLYAWNMMTSAKPNAVPTKSAAKSLRETSPGHHYITNHHQSKMTYLQKILALN